MSIALVNTFREKYGLLPVGDDSDLGQALEDVVKAERAEALHVMVSNLGELLLGCEEAVNNGLEELMPNYTVQLDVVRLPPEEAEGDKNSKVRARWFEIVADGDEEEDDRDDDDEVVDAEVVDTIRVLTNVDLTFTPSGDAILHREYATIEAQVVPQDEVHVYDIPLPNGQGTMQVSKEEFDMYVALSAFGLI